MLKIGTPSLIVYIRQYSVFPHAHQQAFAESSRTADGFIAPGLRRGSHAKAIPACSARP